MMENNIQVYDEFVAKHEAAYAAFRRIYESKNPLPVEAQVRRDLVSLIIVLALTIVSVSSIWVSSSRTVDEFGGGVIGTVAFIMVEGGIMAYAFFRARRTANRERLQRTVQWATAGLLLTFVVALGANIDATLRHKGIELPALVNVVINLLVALSAPTLAFISSDVLAIELMAIDIRKRESEREYEAAQQTWLDGLNRSWAANQKQWDVKIEIHRPSNGIPAESIGILPAKSTLGHTKKPDAAKRVYAYLAENPDAIHQSPLEIAELLEVGKSTVYAVFKSMKEDK